MRPRDAGEAQDMDEHHDITGTITACPLSRGEIGASVRVQLDSPPSPRWSDAFSARLTRELVGCPAVAHLKLDHAVQGADVVLDGVEPEQASRLGEAVGIALGAANGATEHDEPPPPGNMDQSEADAIAARIAGALLQPR
jgi:hypothetical protein